MVKAGAAGLGVERRADGERDAREQRKESGARFRPTAHSAGLHADSHEASMTNESLQSRLAALRAELAATPELDEGTRRAVQQLADAVERRVAAGASSADETPQTIREQLSDRVRELEAAHPQLSATLGNIIDTLAFYGL